MSSVAVLCKREASQPLQLIPTPHKRTNGASKNVPSHTPTHLLGALVEQRGDDAGGALLLLPGRALILLLHLWKGQAEAEPRESRECN